MSNNEIEIAARAKSNDPALEEDSNEFFAHASRADFRQDVVAPASDSFTSKEGRGDEGKVADEGDGRAREPQQGAKPVEENTYKYEAPESGGRDGARTASNSQSSSEQERSGPQVSNRPEGRETQGDKVEGANDQVAAPANAANPVNAATPETRENGGNDEKPNDASGAAAREDGARGGVGNGTGENANDEKDEDPDRRVASNRQADDEAVENERKGGAGESEANDKSGGETVENSKPEPEAKSGAPDRDEKQPESGGDGKDGSSGDDGTVRLSGTAGNDRLVGGDGNDRM
ncbi:MAG: hypothetical protein JXQ99_00330, partial [Hyphomicrobiaceae bacterium]